jgi:hypothetical protein
MTRITVDLSQRAHAAVAEIMTVQECSQSEAVRRALIDYATRLDTPGDLPREAEQIVRVLSDARLSSLTAAFRKLGWPLKFVLTEESEEPLGRDVSDGGQDG